MKSRVLTLMATCAALTALAERTYQEVEFPALKVAAESYERKYVTYTERFLDLSATFWPHMERSGFKSPKYVLLAVGGTEFPVIAKKTDELTATLAALERGALVKVSGKVREFRREPKQTMFPRFYLALDSIEVLAAPAGDTSGPRGRTARLWPKPRRSRP